MKARADVPIRREDADAGALPPASAFGGIPQISTKRPWRDATAAAPVPGEHDCFRGAVSTGVGEYSRARRWPAVKTDLLASPTPGVARMEGRQNGVSTCSQTRLLSVLR